MRLPGGSAKRVRESLKWTRASGPLEPVSLLETRPLLVPFYHAANGFVCCCEHVVNAVALSIMPTAVATAAPSRQIDMGVR